MVDLAEVAAMGAMGAMGAIGETGEIESRNATDSFAAALSGERARLVRFCAHLTGHALVAEDLAQETLFEAWRSRAKLRDLAGMTPWLLAIARNVCLRWQRAQGREQRLYTPASSYASPFTADENTPDPLELISAPDAELSLPLERRELVELLDRAMKLLPAETRTALVASYLDELPQAELAARLGVGEGALRARLHRGRQMLRRVLEDDLRPDALALELVADAGPRWQPTRIWCPFCGIHHLECRIDQMYGAYGFRCAGRCQPGINAIVGCGEQPDEAVALTSPKALLNRHCLIAGAHYASLASGTEMACETCGAPVRVLRWQPGDALLPAPIMLHGIGVLCPRCGPADSASPWHLALDTPQALQFWRRHPRMRALPVRTLEFDGRAALHTGFESSDDSARLDIIAARDTFAVLHTSE